MNNIFKTTLVLMVLLMSTSRAMSADYVVTINTNGNGQVSGGGLYPEGTEVEILATPAQHNHFVRMVSSPNNRYTTSPQLAFTVTGDTVVRAYFASNIYSVVAGGLTTNGSITGLAEYQALTDVTLVAVPATHCVFTGWSGDLAGTSNPYFLTISNNLNISASFDQKSYSINILTNGEGTVTGSGTYPAKTFVDLVAVPAEDYHFVRWEGDKISSSTQLTFSIARDLSVTAVFAKDEYAVSANSVNGEVFGLGSYKVNSVARLFAKPHDGYSFVRWEKDGVYYRRANPLTLTVDGDVALTAYFAPAAYETRLDFNDQQWNTAANNGSHFTDSAHPDLFYVLQGAVNGGISFEYNGTGGSQLSFHESASSNAFIVGPVVNWAEKFSLEARIKKSTASPTALQLVLDNNGVSTLLSWTVNADGRMALSLRDGELYALSSNVVWTAGDWVTLQVVVDLTKTSLTNAVKMYVNGNVEGVLSVGDGSVFGGQFQKGLVRLGPNVYGTKLLRRGTGYAMDVDFIRITANQGTAAGPGYFYSGEIYDQISSNSTASIMIYPESVIVPVQAKVVDGVLMGAVEPDAHPDPVMPFHGIFRIKCALEADDFIGKLIVDIFVKKPEDALFKKIGEVVTPAKPATGPWWITYYWDSRKPAYDWSEADAEPYKTSGNVEIMFKLR